MSASYRMLTKIYYWVNVDSNACHAESTDFTRKSQALDSQTHNSSSKKP